MSSCYYSRCQLCGKFAPLDKHHIYGGAFRSKSEKYKMFIYICRDCHNKIHFSKDGREMMDKLRKEYQIKFHERYPDLDFKEIFKRDYMKGEPYPKQDYYNIEEEGLPYP